MKGSDNLVEKTRVSSMCLMAKGGVLMLANVQIISYWLILLWSLRYSLVWNWSNETCL